MKYRIKLIEKHVYYIDVEADSEELARTKAYLDEKYTLSNPDETDEYVESVEEVTND